MGIEGKYNKKLYNWQCSGPRFKNIPSQNDISSNCMRWQYSNILGCCKVYNKCENNQNNLLKYGIGDMVIFCNKKYIQCMENTLYWEINDRCEKIVADFIKNFRKNQSVN
uniref:Uncharacterized protein n=1 Tax=Strongyloides venezuelensis TaxID=75913 RepID=A0A0K0FDN4_STRVS